MADYTRREETTKKVIYVLPSPTNWTEIGKALTAVERERKDKGLPCDYDDVVTIEAMDDEIHLWFNEDVEVPF